MINHPFFPQFTSLPSSASYIVIPADRWITCADCQLSGATIQYAPNTDLFLQPTFCSRRPRPFKKGRKKLKRIPHILFAECGSNECADRKRLNFCSLDLVKLGMTVPRNLYLSLSKAELSSWQAVAKWDCFSEKRKHCKGSGSSYNNLYLTNTKELMMTHPWVQ